MPYLIGNKFWDIFAFNKIDKPGANPDKIKEQLSGMNFLVEEWGGPEVLKVVDAEIPKPPSGHVFALRAMFPHFNYLKGL